MRARVELPAVGVHQGRRRERPAAIARQAQHHVADITGKYFAPGDGDGVVRAGRDVRAAADAGVAVECDYPVHLRSALTNARYMCVRLVPAFAAVDPREHNGSIGCGCHPLKRMSDGSIFIDAQMTIEALASVD
jgi:hypothetical protein